MVVIKSGALTEIHKNGCATVHPAGSVFFEEADVVHNAINQTGGLTEVYATFMSPAGAPPLIPAGDPGGVCRDRDPDGSIKTSHRPQTFGAGGGVAQVYDAGSAQADLVSPLASAGVWKLSVQCFDDELLITSRSGP